MQRLYEAASLRSRHCASELFECLGHEATTAEYMEIIRRMKKENKRVANENGFLFLLLGDCQYFFRYSWPEMSFDRVLCHVLLVV